MNARYITAVRWIIAVGCAVLALTLVVQSYHSNATYQPAILAHQPMPAPIATPRPMPEPLASRYAQAQRSLEK